MNPVIFKPSSESPQRSQFDEPSKNQQKALKREVARGLRMHRKLAIVVGSIVFALLFTIGLLRTPYYETSSLIYVQPAKAKLITDATGGTYDPTRYDTYIQQQLQTIIRSDILSEALKSLPPGMWTRSNESEQSAIARLQHDLKIEREMGSYQLSISLSGGDPYAITKIVNAVTDAYIEKERVDELAQSEQQLEVLQKEESRLQTALAENRQVQAGLSSSLGVADTAGENGNPYDVQLGELRTQLAAARASNAIAGARVSSVANHGPESAGALKAAADELIAKDTGLDTLKQSINAQRSKIMGQMGGLTPKNPMMAQYQLELDRLDRQLEDETNKIRKKASSQLLDNLKLEAARTADIQSRLQGQLVQQTIAATGATPKLQKAADISAEVTRLQAQLAEVDNAIGAIQLEKKSSGLVHRLLPAEVPLKPQPSKRILILAGALPMGVLFGLLAAWAKHKLDPKIYIGEDVENALGFPAMAVLPAHDEVDGKVLDEFMLRFVAGLDQAHSASGARTYVFTATSPDMNITDLVARLALRMDKLGYRTMILKASSALQNHLSLTSNSDEGVDSWRETRLSDMRLAEGRLAETRLAKSGDSRLMHPRRESFVAENIERLKQNVDLLFIEAFPIRSSTEAEFAARLADITVLIAESAKTTRDDLTSTLETMRRLNVAGVATVLNDVPLCYADDDFIAVVRSVESRQSEVRRRDAEASSHVRENYPLSIYENSDVTSRNEKITSQFQAAGEDLRS